ncbi:phage tail assembly chaperone [Turicimonas muris]|uniref:phage tail assembly chaperone n=1 Tax=Turicimonas muris TaxID=1796652 RepID=UPI0023F0CF10|nr:phage tail assembly chaperone [Turicimonas muris]
MNITEIKQQYLQEALSHAVQNKYGVELADGRITTISDSESFYVESCPSEITAYVDKKYLKGNTVKEEIPIEIVSAPEDFFTGKQVYTFTTPALNADNLKVEVLEKPLIGKAKVKFKAGQNFAIKSELITQPLFRSSDGKYYQASELPEQSDNFVLERYSNEVKVERNARISDTDDYVKLPDITIQKLAKAKRTALTDEDRAYLEAYRQALRNLPETAGFPFVEFPAFPSALAYELQQKVESRERMRQGGF